MDVFTCQGSTVISHGIHATWENTMLEPDQKDSNHVKNYNLGILHIWIKWNNATQNEKFVKLSLTHDVASGLLW